LASAGRRDGGRGRARGRPRPRRRELHRQRQHARGYRLQRPRIAIESIGRLWAHTGSASPAIQADNYTGLGAAVEANGGNDAVVAHASQGHALRANSDSDTAIYSVGKNTGADLEGQNGYGVSGRGTTQGVIGQGPTGVEGDSTTSGGSGVTGHGNTPAGTFGTGVIAQGDEGVVARGTTIGVDASANGTAVAGISNNEYGGFFGGKQAPIRLVPASTAGAPTTGTHRKGELYIDNQGSLFLCTADSLNGNAGTWKKVVLQ
jgi:hypothetical protein